MPTTSGPVSHAGFCFVKKIAAEHGSSFGWPGFVLCWFQGRAATYTELKMIHSPALIEHVNRTCVDPGPNDVHLKAFSERYNDVFLCEVRQVLEHGVIPWKLLVLCYGIRQDGNYSIVEMSALCCKDEPCLFFLGPRRRRNALWMQPAAPSAS